MSTPHSSETVAKATSASLTWNADAPAWDAAPRPWERSCSCCWLSCAAPSPPCSAFAFSSYSFLVAMDLFQGAIVERSFCYYLVFSLKSSFPLGSSS